MLGMTGVVVLVSTFLFTSGFSFRIGMSGLHRGKSIATREPAVCSQ